MTDTTSSHPDVVFSNLLTASPHPRRQRTLNAIHDLCRRLHQTGARDFAVSAIAKQCEAAGICKAHSLYHGLAADYRTLINAWGTFGGPPPPPPPVEASGSDTLMRIPDPAVRSVMQGIIAERDKIRAQLNTIKAQTKLVIDMRPVSVFDSNASSSSVPTLMPYRIADTERAMLRAIVSRKFLEEEGWKEGEHGEITIIDTGRIVFPYGFTTVIRRIVES
jgi:hypothetical protein